MKNIDFSKGVRGKYSKMDLRVIGDKREKSQTSWAICVTGDEKNLIPLKMYEVRVRENFSEVEIIKNESDMPAIYPHEYFLVIRLLENEVELLNKVSLSI